MMADNPHSVGWRCSACAGVTSEPSGTLARAWCPNCDPEFLPWLNYVYVDLAEAPTDRMTDI